MLFFLFWQGGRCLGFPVWKHHFLTAESIFPAENLVGGTIIFVGQGSIRGDGQERYAYFDYRISVNIFRSIFLAVFARF